MKSGFWLRIINVYPSEWALVKRLYLLQFFQGAGIAFLFTSAFAQFLEKFPITQLPWVMVCSALLLWVTGFLYTRLEHVMKFGKFNVSIILFMAGSMLALWIANYASAADWLLYFMMAWFNVLYMLNNMEFWAIAALLFDLRQSKRLFAVISAGDIPAKFIGYTLALIFVPYTGTKNLLLIGAICVLASLPFFLGILKSQKWDIPHEPAAKRKPAKAKAEKRPIRKLVTNLASNPYIRDIAFISLITSTCVILINYGFYGEVKKAYHDDVELASFIALFYGSLRVVAFVTKMVFSSRLTASLGIRPALFITPVGMLVLILAITAIHEFSRTDKMVFYLFGIASIVVDVLRTAFNSPVLLTLMQPLPTHERLRAHNIVKGIMDPFASFFSGVFLLTLFYLHDKVDLMFLSYVLLVLGTLWIIGVVLVNRRYLNMLMKTIGSRYFSRDEFDLNDEQIVQQVRTKMMTGTEIEVINILSMLNSKKIDKVAEGLILQLLEHPSDQVRIESVRLITNKNFLNVREHLERLLEGESSTAVKTEAVKVYCRIGEIGWNIAAYLDHPDEDIRNAAIKGMLSNNEPYIQENAKAVITGLLLSPEESDKKKAISILHDVKDQYDHPHHIHLLNDPDSHIRDLAIKAIGKASHEETLRALFGYIPSQEKQILAAFYNAGPAAIPLLHERIISGDVSENLKEKLIVVCGKIGGETAIKVLVELLKKEPQHRAAVIRALHRCKYTAGPETQQEFESIARGYIVYGVELLYMLQAVPADNPRYELLSNSLQYEINDIREILLTLFGCMYDRQKMNQVKSGLTASRKESIANAMEIIELTVKKDIGRQFNTMFETSSIEQRCATLRSLFTENQFREIEHILERILSEKPVQYYNWTKACSLYISKKYLHPLDTGLYKKFVTSENILLKETALFAATT